MEKNVEFEFKATDSLLIRATKITEITMLNLYANESKIGIMPVAIFRVLQALEKYKEIDSSAEK